MPRLAVSMDDSEYDWIDDESDSRGVSMAQVIRDLIAAARGRDSPYDSVRERDSGGDSGSDTLGDTPGDTPSDSVIHRLEQLEERLAIVEERLDADRDGHDREGDVPIAIVPGVADVDQDQEGRAGVDADVGTLPREEFDQIDKQPGPEFDAHLDAATDPSIEVSRAERVREVVDAVAAGWDDAPDRLDARKDAAAAALRFALDAEGAVGRSDVVPELYDEFPVEGQSEETWYRKNVRPVLQEVGEYSQGQHGYTEIDLDRVLDE